MSWFVVMIPYLRKSLMPFSLNDPFNVAYFIFLELIATIACNSKSIIFSQCLLRDEYKSKSCHTSTTDVYLSTKS